MLSADTRRGRLEDMWIEVEGLLAYSSIYFGDNVIVVVYESKGKLLFIDAVID